MPLSGTKASFPFFNEERLFLTVSHRIVTKQVFEFLLLFSSFFAVVLFVLLSDLPPKIDQSRPAFVAFSCGCVCISVSDEVTVVAVVVEDSVGAVEVTASVVEPVVDADTCTVVG